MRVIHLPEELCTEDDGILLKITVPMVLFDVAAMKYHKPALVEVAGK